MGEHKHNPTAIMAKNGELPPRKSSMVKYDIQTLVQKEFEKKLGLNQIYNIIERKY